MKAEIGIVSCRSCGADTYKIIVEVGNFGVEVGKKIVKDEMTLAKVICVSCGHEIGCIGTVGKQNDKH